MRIPLSTLPSNRFSLLLLFGAAVVGGAIWAKHARVSNLQKQQVKAHADNHNQHRDQTLQDSFPASDAPATRDYAIPINAR